MCCLKTIGLLIVIFANLANCQTDDFHSDNSSNHDDTGDDFKFSDDPCDDKYLYNDDVCGFYDDFDCAKKCHHDKFRDVTPLKKMFGDKVKTCCSGHQYYFTDYCEV